MYRQLPAFPHLPSRTASAFLGDVFFPHPPPIPEIFFPGCFFVGTRRRREYFAKVFPPQNDFFSIFPAPFSGAGFFWIAKEPLC
jgi:hypothetical protein